MKRALFVVAVSAVGLIPLWRFEPSAGTSTVVADAPAPAQAPAAAGAAPDPAGSATPGADGTPPTAATGGTRVISGPTIATKHGNVQVEITYTGDRITSARLLKQPDSGPTRKAVPQLVQETLVAQSADVDSVSGATTTSQAYVKSLQAAIDAKGA
ncbi:FMN-binding protein (plasmid) [Embleya sp. NBC_00888]|uniref:FMN-binding protein n=1 Tax=Embleya sp. NBC_00888 TaxID=2975960 RepID=UPI002F9087CF|nr:FMN-binding protein [Embleya sp. NBC_00888]